MNNSKLALPLLLLFLGLLACNEHPFSQGEILYNNFCASCHMEDGVGLRGVIPPLAKADYLRDNPLQIACIIRNGIEGPIQVNGKTYDQPMEGIPQLTEFEIANIINYIHHSWENNLEFVKIDEVRATLATCK